VAKSLKTAEVKQLLCSHHFQAANAPSFNESCTHTAAVHRVDAAEGPWAQPWLLQDMLSTVGQG
jgi:hypothetical protein